MSGDGIPIPLEIVPGINKDITEYAAEGAWVSCDHMRFRDDKAEKIGGWVHEQTFQYTNTSITTFHGIARDIQIWTDLNQNKYIALAGTQKLELLSGGLYYDITPIVTTVTVNNKINTSIGSSQVIVSITGHNGLVGDYVIFASVGATVGGNVYLSGEYTITTVPSTDAFGVSVAVCAAATSTGAGGNLQTSFLLPTGIQSNGGLVGWGAGTWGSGGWGVGVTGGTAFLSQWSLDTYGQDLLACRRGGYLYRWSASAGPLVRAAIVTAAPTINNIVMVDNPTKHVLSFGCTDTTGAYDPLLVRWSDQDNINDWTPTVSNAAGEYPLQGGNQIVAAQPTKRGTLILTDDVIHVMSFTGDESTFAFEQIAQGAGAVSQHCAVDVNGTVYWMGLGSFYKYDGQVKPKSSTLDKYLFRADSEGSVNQEQKEKTFTGTNSAFNEIIWLYPSRDSLEIDRYVIHNYVDDLWYIGTMDRTVWADIGVFSKPYAANTTGILMIHEEGFNDDADPLLAYLESAWFDIEDGEQLLFMDRFIPDIRRLNGKNLSLTLQVKKYPESVETVTKGPYIITNTTDKISFRARGRQAKIILEQEVTDGSFELGKNRVNIQPDGKR